MVSKSDVKGGIMLVIGFMLVVLVGAEILPTAFDSWFNASTGSWDGITAALWLIAPAFAVLGVLFYFLGQAFDLF